MMAISRATYVAGITLAFASLLASSVWAGGLGENHSHDKPSYFGFVKDASGKPIADAKVKAEVKGRFALVARTDGTGMYKIPELTKDVSRNPVTISCSKEGYQQTRTFTRSGKNAKPPIQVECTMQRLSAK
jgi:hypothetical protein